MENLIGKREQRLIEDLLEHWKDADIKSVRSAYFLRVPGMGRKSFARIYLHLFLQGVIDNFNDLYSIGQIRRELVNAGFDRSNMPERAWKALMMYPEFDGIKGKTRAAIDVIGLGPQELRDSLSCKDRLSELRSMKNVGAKSLALIAQRFNVQLPKSYTDKDIIEAWRSGKMSADEAMLQIYGR
jgi:hypothetical protein